MFQYLSLNPMEGKLWFHPADSNSYCMHYYYTGAASETSKDDPCLYICVNQSSDED